MANKVYECIAEKAYGRKKRDHNSEVVYTFKKGQRIEVDETKDSWMRACKRDGNPWVYYYTDKNKKKPAWEKVRDANGNWLDGSAGSTTSNAQITQNFLSKVDEYKKVTSPPQWIAIT